MYLDIPRTACIAEVQCVHQLQKQRHVTVKLELVHSNHKPSMWEYLDLCQFSSTEVIGLKHSGLTVSYYQAMFVCECAKIVTQFPEPQYCNSEC